MWRFKDEYFSSTSVAKALLTVTVFMFLHCFMHDTEGLAQRNGSSRVLMFHLLSSLVVVFFEP